MPDLKRINEQMQEAFYEEWKKERIRENLKTDLHSYFIISQANLVNSYARKYATKRISNKMQGEIIDSETIFRVQTSSQAMVFNLFTPFIQMMNQGFNSNVNAIFNHIFPEQKIKEITKIEIEYYPQDLRERLFDTGAMDVIVEYVDKKNQKGFIAVEVKYSEPLNHSEVDWEHFIECVKKTHAFTNEGERKLTNKIQQATQIYRNYVLAETYALEGGFESHHSVILALNQHKDALFEVQALREDIVHKDSISFLSLQCFIKKTLSVCDPQYINLFEKFNDRYLNFLKLASNEKVKKILRLELERYEMNINYINRNIPKYNAFAHFSKGTSNYRWREILQIGNSTDIIGNVFLFQPKLIEKHHPEPLFFHHSPILHDGVPYYKFECDNEIYDNIFRLFYERHLSHYKNDYIEGVIQIFYLHNDMNITKKTEAKKKKSEGTLPKDAEKDYNFISKLQKKDFLLLPTYIGWGGIQVNHPFRRETEQIFNIVVTNNNYLNRKFDQNKFYTPETIMNRMIFTGENKLHIRYSFITGFVID